MRKNAVLLSLISFSCPALADTIFLPEDTVALGTAAMGVTAVDIDSDGLPDLVHVSNNVDALNVYINTGPDKDSRANFEKREVLRTGIEPRDSVSGDFDGDGNRDLAVSNHDDDTVSVFYGDGAGHFSLAHLLRTGEGPDRLVSADFNSDGYDDVAVNEMNDTSVGVFLSTGDSFARRSVFQTTGNLASLAVADIDADGELDLVIGGDRFQWRRNEGDGQFHEMLSLDLGARIADIAVDDLSRDGRPDALIAFESRENLRVLLHDGSAYPYSDEDPEDSDFVDDVSAGGAPQRIQLMELSGDQDPDLVATLAASDGFVYLEGAGFGKFVERRMHASGQVGQPGEIDVADVDGDGRLDVIVATSTAASVFRGLNELDYDSFQTHPLGTTPTMPARARLDFDQFDDVVMADSAQPVLYLMRSNGEMELLLGGTIALPSPATGIVVRDLDDSGLDDLLVVSSGSTTIDVYSATGPASIAFQTAIEAPGRIGSIAIGGTGNELLVTDPASRMLHLYAQREPFAWSLVDSVQLSSRPIELVAGDVDRDGTIEAAILGDQDERRLTVFRIEGEQLREIQAVDSGTVLRSLAFNDVDQDGDDDIAVLSELRSELHVYRNEGGRFGESPETYPTEEGPVDVLFDDVDEDGDDDAIVLAAHKRRLGVLYREDGGYVVHGNYLEAPAVPSTGALADLNADGRKEVVVTLPSDGTFAIVGKSENEAPVADDLTFWLDDDETVVEEFLLATDINNDDLVYIIEQYPDHGTVELLDASSGLFRYETGSGFDERDNFTYRASDGSAISEEAVIGIHQEDDEGGGALSPWWLALGLLGLVAARRRRELSA